MKMETIDQKTIKSVETLEKRFAGDTVAEEFEMTNQKFEELIEKGYTKKRGYNLLSATDAHLKRQVWFNVKL